MRSRRRKMKVNVRFMAFFLPHSLVSYNPLQKDNAFLLKFESGQSANIRLKTSIPLLTQWLLRICKCINSTFFIIRSIGKKTKETRLKRRNEIESKHRHTIKTVLNSGGLHERSITLFAGRDLRFYFSSVVELQQRSSISGRKPHTRLNLGTEYASGFKGEEELIRLSRKHRFNHSSPPFLFRQRPRLKLKENAHQKHCIWIRFSLKIVQISSAGRWNKKMQRSNLCSIQAFLFEYFMSLWSTALTLTCLEHGKL